MLRQTKKKKGKSQVIGNVTHNKEGCKESRNSKKGRKEKSQLKKGPKEKSHIIKKRFANHKRSSHIMGKFVYNDEVHKSQRKFTKEHSMILVRQHIFYEVQNYLK